MAQSGNLSCRITLMFHLLENYAFFSCSMFRNADCALCRTGGTCGFMSIFLTSVRAKRMDELGANASKKVM